MLKTVFVVDNETSLLDSRLEAISFDAYLCDYPRLNEPRIRIINLCDTSRYLSRGYYCSLLADARRHHVVPSVKVINELRETGTTLWVQHTVLGKQFLAQDHNEQHPIVICMGEVADSRFRKLASLVFQKYATPILTVYIANEATGLRIQIKRVSLSELTESDSIFCLNTLEHYSQKVWRSKAEEKKFRWDMAILINPEEDMPPSNKAAIARFVKAGEKLGIRTRTITANEFSYLAQYDALFIRETTAIDHYTYRFAREAENQGLVVIDDSNSILRCCNKVFLHDAFSYHQVPSLPSKIIANLSDHTLESIEESLHYPLVLKMPESSFSKGVYKVESRTELLQVARELLQESALVLAQKYL
ncbi:MAG: RimK-like ATPgrasp N-terminal domain-containing protein [Gammaproteobacteria bacterium]